MLFRDTIPLQSGVGAIELFSSFSEAVDRSLQLTTYSMTGPRNVVVLLPLYKIQRTASRSVRLPLSMLPRITYPTPFQLEV